jgi:hypothetical protein
VDQGTNFDGVFAIDPNGATRSFFGEALDQTASFGGLNDAAGSLGALNYVKADGSQSGDFVYDAAGIQRVETYQDPTQTPVQGVKVFNSSGNPVAHLP